MNDRNIKDFSRSSGILIDNVRIRNVPEPGGLQRCPPAPRAEG